jgi:hypothetical protein
VLPIPTRCLRFTLDSAQLSLALRDLLRPIGIDVLQDLVDSGDLDPDIIAQMPTFIMAGTEVAWKIEDGPNVVKPKPDKLHCPNSYLCPLRPGSTYCN